MSEAYEAAVEIREAVLEIARWIGSEEMRKERRRYALLQAAATIQAVPVPQTSEHRGGYGTGPIVRTTSHVHPAVDWCVDRAVALLDEIERRKPPSATQSDNVTPPGAQKKEIGEKSENTE